jgi:glycosyltransferase involved in cell wall biosynthesis
MKKLSILVPIYNGAQYIEPLMDCILKQLTDDVELLMIDDGSKDNSLDIIKKYAAKNVNIRYLSQQNNGIGITRNKLLAEAEGFFVWYVDQDDIVEKDIIKNITDKVDEQYDMINIGTSQIRQTGEIVKKYFPKCGEYASGLEMIAKGYRNNELWDKVIRRQFLIANHFSFGIYNGMDDFYMSFHFMAECGKIKTINKLGYCHVINPMSYSQNFDESVRRDWAEGSYNLAFEINMYIKSKQKNVQDQLNVWFSLWMLGFIFSLVRFKYTDRYDRKMIKRLKDIELYPVIPKMLSKKLHIVTYILNSRIGYFLTKLFMNWKSNFCL